MDGTHKRQIIYTDKSFEGWILNFQYENHLSNYIIYMCHMRKNDLIFYTIYPNLQVKISNMTAEILHYFGRTLSDLGLKCILTVGLLGT